MVSRETMSRVLKLGLEPGAVTRPRQAAMTAALLLAVAALAWLLVARPWDQVGVGRPAPSSRVSIAEVTRLLSRSGYGPGGSSVRILWATPEYFRLTGQLASAAHYDVQRHLVFFVWEDIHDGDLPDALPLALRVDGTATYTPAQVFVPADAVHHRFSVLLYPRTDARGAAILGSGVRSLEIILPPANAEGAQSILHWPLPIQYPQGMNQPAFSFTWASVLALLGGVLASMWPCLFQLTAYFIPTLAGISMSQARSPSKNLPDEDRLSGGGGGRWASAGSPENAKHFLGCASGQESAAILRLRVVKTAALFVLGFVIVYTAAGAATGYAAQSLQGTSIFWTYQRPLSIAAGLVMLFMAIRLAANARAPLVCKMPVASFLGNKQTGPVGTMLLGLAFATGCTTCFGAALILGIAAYVGIAGTPLYGALTMLLFSLGMAVPLIAGAAVMARALAVLGRLEKVAPYMVLASSAVMTVFAVLLLSGRYMGVSNWFFSAVPGLIGGLR